jgi:hypothetical protein|tara:strand:+ start:33 stop:749 length:717 start_codon:yes stop_codon:yes gene_type:complete
MKNEKQKKLVTFGDSFIAQHLYMKELEPESWIDYICKENSYVFDGYGCAETGIDNTIVNFLNYLEDFDVCIFAWSDPNREYIPLRNLKSIKGGSWNFITDKEKNIGSEYRKYFSDITIENIRSVSILQWFDRHLQKHYKDKKFIHLYCFELEDLQKHSKFRLVGDKFYPHIFKRGINIKPELIKFSKLLDFKTVDEDRPLHMADKVSISFAKQLNKVLKDESLVDGNIVKFDLEYMKD